MDEDNIVLEDRITITAPIPTITTTPTSDKKPKKSKVDFVRFDSTEIHYTDNDEIKMKINEIQQ